MSKREGQVRTLENITYRHVLDLAKLPLHFSALEGHATVSAAAVDEQPPE